MNTGIRNIYILVFAIGMLCSAQNALNAQKYVNTPVEVSKERVRVNGKICYSHVVQDKQTLFSISKAYGVTVEDIYKFNPSLKETGLKKNSILIIPSADEVKPAEVKPVETDKPVEAAEQAEEKSVEEEAVEEKPVEEKTEAAPAPQEEPVREVAKEKRSRRLHTVKWYEDLDVIASHYGISVEEIMAANKLKGRKLTKRQKLIIPYPGEIQVLQKTVAETVKDTTVAVAAATPEEDEVKEDTLAVVAFVPKTKVDATLILPLTNAEGAPNRNNMDFYSGALLAVYDKSETGLDCNLNVYDIMDNKSHFSIETISGSDFVIGPVSAADLTKLFNSVSDAKAVVSPLDPRTERLMAAHPEMIQAPTPQSAQYKDLVKWMKEEMGEGDKVMMISEKGARLSGINSLITEALDSSALAYQQFSYSILEGRDVTDPLMNMMTTEGANRIIIASESEAFVNDVVRNLNLLIYNNLDIVLYAPSKIRGFETIEVENFHNTSMRVSLSYYIDYESEAVKDFLMKYRALYNTEPTQFAFQGYDLMKYFIDMNEKYGSEWKAKLPESSEKMLQSTFEFISSPSGALINNGVRRIIYDKGYKVTMVK